MTPNFIGNLGPFRFYGNSVTLRRFNEGAPKSVKAYQISIPDQYQASPIPGVKAFTFKEIESCDAASWSPDSPSRYGGGLSSQLIV
jgi:hypothetical protein